MALYAVVIKTAIRSLYPMKPEKKSKDRPTLLEEQEQTHIRIGNRLRQLREATGLSQEKFANQHELDRRQLSRVETGHNVNINTLITYCRALEITLQEFFAGME